MSWFFGYGSLVNADTHAYPDTTPAILRGWRRSWVQVSDNIFSNLSANHVDQGEIEGLTARVPDNDWDALDEREQFYTRHPIGHLITPPIETKTIQTYSIPIQDYEKNAAPKPILLSYLDVVLKGYDAVFGRDGVARFIATTDGWERPILDDRNNPLYPRHQPISANEKAWINAIIKTLPSSLIHTLENVSPRP